MTRLNNLTELIYLLTKNQPFVAFILHHILTANSYGLLAMSLIANLTFEAVDRIRQASSHEDIFRELQRCGTIFGYDAFLIAGLPLSPNQNLSECKIISGWPAGWEKRYQAKRYIHIDPVIRYIRGVSDPFLWREAVDAAGRTDGRIVIGEARDFGLNDGFCVPFHQIDGTEAGVSFGGARFHLARDERAALHLLAIYAMSTAKAIVRRHAEPTRDAESETGLTAREMECLKWSAIGKTAWEISVILSISRRTVEGHLANATYKLGAVSRVHCVAEALRRGIIR